MAYVIKDKITGFICGEIIITDKNKLRQIEREYIVIPSRNYEKKEVVSHE